MYRPHTGLVQPREEIGFGVVMTCLLTNNTLFNILGQKTRYSWAYLLPNMFCVCVRALCVCVRVVLQSAWPSTLHLSA